MIVIIDYDMGNLASIKNMLHRIGCDDVIISGDYHDIQNADKLILPGVGAFDQGVTNLKNRGLFGAIKEAVIENKKLIMGICLGMQLMGFSSEEGDQEGLGLIPFNTVKFKFDGDYKIPHMGWNEVSIEQPDNLIVNGLLEEKQRYYFVHSYHAVCEKKDDILMKCNYGYDFTAAVAYENKYGFQFHPEKSHRFGMKILENYVRL